MKCESKFVTGKSRSVQLVDCNAYVNSFWRGDKYCFGIRVAHSWMQGKGSQEIAIDLSPLEAIELGKSLIDEAARRLKEDARRAHAQA